MNTYSYHFLIMLAEGSWNIAPTEAAVRKALSPFLEDDDQLADEECSDDACFQAKFTVYSSLPYRDAEIHRDLIVEALMRSLAPEYESMVEVEILDQW